MSLLSTSTHTHPLNGPLSKTTRVSQYQKSKTNLDFTEARDNEWQWHQLGHMQVCISLQTDNHATTPPLSFLQAGCPSCRPTNSVKALKALFSTSNTETITNCWEQFNFELPSVTLARHTSLFLDKLRHCDNYLIKNVMHT